MEIVPLVPAGRQVIQSYGGGGFVVAGVRHAGSVVVFPNRTFAWPAASRADVASLPVDVLVAAAAEIDLLLLGFGIEGGVAPATLRAALKNAGIAVEAMPTAAACRTFNVLMAEERRVAAALLAIE